MNADAFRNYYEYHFSENRKVWDLASGLPDEAFRQDAPYSHGSVREQILHLIDAENAWFGDLRAAAGHPYTEGLAKPRLPGAARSSPGCRRRQNGRPVDTR